MQVFQNALRGELRRFGRRQELADIESRIDLTELRKRFSQQRQEMYQAGYRLGIEFVKERVELADLLYCEGVDWDVKKVIRALLTSGDPWEGKLLEEAQSFAGVAFTHMGAVTEVEAGFVDALRYVYERAADPDGPWNWH
ncbi:MAG: hypothetical protein HY690_18480 [Chloroflexi bacterium]|nr:hypothetical protein [Chloroflexota bacterium]